MNINYFDKNFYNQSTAYVIASYQPVKAASDLLRQAIKSILKFKDKNVSLWVVDIGSPDADYLITPEEFPEVNFIYRSFEIRSYGFSIGIKARLLEILKLNFIPKRNGSYANGYMLDYIVKIFKEKKYYPEYFITSQQDIVILTNNFFVDMKKKFMSKTFAVGVLKQKNKSNEFDILHSVCCMWKYKYILLSEEGFLPKLPRFDAGEKIVLEFKNKGLEIDYFKNSYNDPSVLKKIEKKFLEIGEGIDRAINENSEVIFMHLGRGLGKSQGTYKKQNRVGVEKWLDWCRENL